LRYKDGKKQLLKLSNLLTPATNTPSPVWHSNNKGRHVKVRHRRTATSHKARSTKTKQCGFMSAVDFWNDGLRRYGLPNLLLGKPEGFAAIGFI